MRALCAQTIHAWDTPHAGTPLQLTDDVDRLRKDAPRSDRGRPGRRRVGSADARSTSAPSDRTSTTSRCSARGSRAATPGRLAGWALHLQNGALFGAAYANLAPRLPLPSWARGPVAASAENLLTWPLTALTDRLHPARKELPALLANPRAFAQSAWRHLLFGVLLGEIERRLNAQEPVAPAPVSRVHRLQQRSRHARARDPRRLSSGHGSRGRLRLRRGPSRRSTSPPPQPPRATMSPMASTPAP